ncbi:EamA family transporter [Phenylobacterium aquaticum]|uniref:EamA family transporter n=1 Tax=Phenylobacterium aquaticum TaxID=1763816 RepID=UPI0026EC3E75|nr:EamA family transporter [Phenylobacterium aquaticum]
MKTRDAVLCGAFALALPAGQLLFKWASIQDAGIVGPLPWRLLRNLPLIGALGWYGLTALIWFYILTRMPLSQAYPFSILGSALAPVAAWLVFGSPLSWTMAAGFVLMFAGLAIITRAQRG